VRAGGGEGGDSGQKRRRSFFLYAVVRVQMRGGVGVPVDLSYSGHSQ
jgi:hypothetical protein